MLLKLYFFMVTALLTKNVLNCYLNLF
uniref:Uncharacterized protein n=2 Tax=Anguilla anguilla TaxID=7936 RepID=A0A0E9QGX1_ANGAN